MAWLPVILGVGLLSRHLGGRRLTILVVASFAYLLFFGLWQSAIPSRFVDELPPEVVEVNDTGSAYGGYGYGGRSSRFSNVDPFDSLYETPGWKRAQSFTAGRSPAARPARHALIEGDGRLVATGDPKSGGDWSLGQRVFHQKFGYGEIMGIEGDKLDIEFDHAGLKKIVARFVVDADSADDVPF